MASTTEEQIAIAREVAPPNDAQNADLWSAVKRACLPVANALASLKLTVVLFSLAIFLIFTGTLAQTQHGIWYLLQEHFRTWYTWIDWRIFCQDIFYTGQLDLPDGFPYAFPFPGGKLIGILMAINLLAAHGLRFRVQARGSRLAAGLVVIAVGCVMTGLVILGGSQDAAADEPRYIEWSVLSTVIKATLGALWFVTLYGLVTVSAKRRIERWALAAALVALSAVLGCIFYQGKELVLSQASLRIVWQLIQGGVASLVLLGGCALVFARRGGIVLLHAGIGLLMFNELLVATLHVETQMRIREGESTNFSFDTRTAELAVIDTTDDQQDVVVSIPESRLTDGKVIRADELPLADGFPWDIRVVKFMPNSQLAKVNPNDPNRATEGLGQSVIAKEIKPVTGLGGEINVDSAYVELIDPRSSEKVGTYLLSTMFDLQDSSKNQTPALKHDGRTYELALRFRRHYKPYTMKLVDFRFDRFPGTNRPKDFTSELVLTDNERNLERPVKIWMNNPLKYRGETFYQADWDKRDEKGTVLQVVANVGWMIPYVCCMMVLAGMLGHFGTSLLSFLRRRAEVEVPSERVGGFALIFPWIVVGFGALYLARAAMPSPASETFHLEEFGRLPVEYNGRVQPLDTLARNSLRLLSERETYLDESIEPRSWITRQRNELFGLKGSKQPAIRWFLDVISVADQESHHKVFRIDSLEVLDALGLKRREGFRYSVDDLAPVMKRLDEQTAQAGRVPEDDRTAFQRNILELNAKVEHYLFDLRTAFGLPIVQQDNAIADLQRQLGQQAMLSRSEPPQAVPPATEQDQWTPVSTAVLPAIVLQILQDPQLREELMQNPDIVRQMQANPQIASAFQRLSEGGTINPHIENWLQLLMAYHNNDAPAFNKALADYRSAIEKNPPGNWDVTRTDFEAAFYQVSPFYRCAVLYLLAFGLAACALLGWSVPLNRASFWLIALAFVFHTAALIGRMYISGRPPVTNLYSSAVFIGWGIVLLSLIMEAIFKLGIGNLVASIAGFATLLIAYFLAGDGDTLGVLQPVLDTQFWLTTHVVCITLGYATTLLAGLLAIIYVLLHLLTKSLDSDDGKVLARMIYGTICFATLLSLLGTVLGGLWADDSWGRFWGWDPKENGALIIVLWNALILHARWGGIVRQRGMAVLAIMGNIVTVWSWFGVNELGAGLHSYGFTEGTRFWLMLFVVSQVTLMALGMLTSEQRRGETPSTHAAAG